MILDLIDSGQINGYYILAIPFAAAWLLAIATVALGVASMWLANSEQPVPHTDAWAWHEGRTNWKSTVR